MMSKILTPVDLTDASLPAVHEAAALAVSFGAELILLHADELPVLVHGELPYLPQYVYDERAAELQGKLDALVAEASHDGARARGLLVHGPALDGISSVADAERVDLIVLGTHARRGLHHLLLGSVAERVIRTAKVPVLTVRAADHEHAEHEASA